MSKKHGGLSMELTYKEVEERGIDTSMINVCSRIRRIAKLERVRLDEVIQQTRMHRQWKVGRLHVVHD